jgi:flagellar biosynthesis GTPase FlhF
MSETRTYRGGSLEELLPRIRAELGDDAVVVRQREGLTGGVAGFFQKRTVEIEARRGENGTGVEWFGTEPDEEAVVTPSPRFTTVPAPEAEPAEAPAREPAPEAEPAEAPAREPQAVAAAVPAGTPAQPAPRNSPFAAYLSAAAATPPDAPAAPAAGGGPEPAPSQATAEPIAADRVGDAFPNAEELMREALSARAGSPASEPIVTSPNIDAIPVPEQPARPAAREPAPAAAPGLGPPVAAPEPPRAGPPRPEAPRSAPPAAQPAVARPQAARHLITTLTGRGLDAAFAANVVDDALLHRLPLEPMSTLTDAVAAELAARIPVAMLSGPAARTLVLAGAAGSGAARLVAGIAAAYASRTTIEVACIALRTPDVGRALAEALAPLGVPVHAAADGPEAATHAGLPGPGALILVDTPPVTSDDAGRLARDLRALGRHELHLALGPGGGPSAAGLLQALRPQRLALGDPSDPLHLGAALQAAIDAGCPLTFVASTAAAGRPDLAVHPADAAALARMLTA